MTTLPRRCLVCDQIVVPSVEVCQSCIVWAQDNHPGEHRVTRRFRSHPPYWWLIDLGRAWVEVGRLTRPRLRLRRDEIRCWTWYVRWGVTTPAQPALDPQVKTSARGLSATDGAT